MIKPTFYNLPKEKRNKIIEVTRKEFSQGHKKKITINNVIEKAGISRGSFYQYFDDKLDLVSIVVDDMLEKVSSFLQKELITNNGNIFIIPLKIYDIMIAQNNDLSKLMSIGFQNDQNSDLVEDYMQYRWHHNSPFDNILKYIDTSDFEDKSEDNISCVVYMLMGLIKTSIFNVKNGINSKEKERELLIRKIRIIEHGAVRDK